jgi:hypothetical protein
VDLAPETCPRSATPRSTLSYTKCDADHGNGSEYFAFRYFCSPCDLDRNSCHGGRSSPGTPRSAQSSRYRGNLGRTRRRSPVRYSGQVPLWGDRVPGRSARGLAGETPRPILRVRGDGGAQVGSIVMALSPLRYLLRSTRSAPAGDTWVTTASCALLPPLYSVRRACSMFRTSSGCAGKPVRMCRNTCHHCQLRTASFLLPRKHRPDVRTPPHCGGGRRVADDLARGRSAS